jgi:hypothetical protein
MTFFMNGRDEPRIAFNYRAPGAQKNALLANDSTPFRIQPRPTIDFFSHQSGCNIPLEVTGFMSSANNDSGCKWFISIVSRSPLTSEFSSDCERQTRVHH